MHRNIPWKFCEYLTWFGWYILDLKNVYLFFFCLFIYLFVFFCFNHRETPTKSYPENFVKIQLDLAEIFRILKMFICFCLFVCLFIYWFVCFYFNHLGAPTGSYPENLERSDFIWLIYLGSKRCLFVYFFCLFVGLFVFYINHLGIPTGIYPQNFVKIWHDLAEMYRI